MPPPSGRGHNYKRDRTISLAEAVQRISKPVRHEPRGKIMFAVSNERSTWGNVFVGLLTSYTGLFYNYAPQ